MADHLLSARARRYPRLVGRKLAAEVTIYAYLGTPGSGKSYYATKEICESKKREVFANFPMIRPRPNWHYIHNDDLTPQRLVHETHKWADGPVYDETLICPLCEEPLRMSLSEGRALLVIDECGGLFNADQSINRTKQRKEWLDFFAQHRKLGYDIIMVTQIDRQVDVQIRGCWEITVTHFKMNERYWLLFSLPFIVLPKRRRPTFFMRVSHWYHMRRFGGRVTFGICLPWIARRYDSMRLFSKRDDAAAISRRRAPLAERGAGAAEVGIPVWPLPPLEPALERVDRAGPYQQEKGTP
jgi:zona occludens toxin